MFSLASVATAAAQEAYEGYTLFSTLNSEIVSLLDSDGNVVHS